MPATIKVYSGHGKIGVGALVKLANFRRWWINCHNIKHYSVVKQRLHLSSVDRFIACFIKQTHV